LIKSYYKLRQAIGWMALIFPFAIILGSWTGGIIPMGYSISSYYWATSHVLFVGMLSISGSFLVFYYGYDKWDNIITNAAGIGLLLVVSFPCTGGDSYLFLFFSASVTNTIHSLSAAITFCLLGYMSYFQFTKTDKERSEEKIKRDRVYKICGIIIFITLGLIVLNAIIPGLQDFTNGFRLFFWFESLVLWSFGFSWLVKGGFLFSDKESSALLTE
jgi:hypothetical protein